MSVDKNKPKSDSSLDKNKPKGDLGLLEEDDEFEEFPAEDFNLADEDDGANNVWEDNWDDDNIEDDFSQQLKVHQISKAMET